MKTHKQLFYSPLIVLFLLSLLFSNCTPYYIAPNFDTRASIHKTIAILPVEMVYTGKIPEDLSELDIQNLEEAESKAFQVSFYRALLRSTKSGRKAIHVDIQPYRQTWRGLEENQIGISEVWGKSPEDLARILDVDAVVMARIEKTRFMSDLESYGIDLATHVVNVISNYSLLPWIPVSPISKQVKADYSLYDSADGIAIWSISQTIAADWHSPSNVIIDDISWKAAKKFPYR